MGRKKSNDNRLAELHISRESIKYKLEAFVSFVSKIKDEYHISNTFDEATRNELQFRNDKVKELLSKFDIVQDEIETLCETPKEEFDVRSEIEDRFCATFAEAKVLLDHFNASQTNGNSSIGLSTASLDLPQSKSVRLPTIDLPKFSGNYNDWLEYRDTFTSVIHNNNSIDEILKFQYLKSSLKGEAATVIQFLEISKQNYALAWKLLCGRYNNKRLLVSNHIRALFSLANLDTESSKGIRQLVDEASQHLRALDTLDQPVEHWDSFIIHLVNSKLDPITAREWESQTLDTEIPTWQKFLSFLHGRANMLETLNIDSSNSKPFSQNHNSKFKSRETNRSNIKTFVSSNSSHCTFCNGSHTISACSEFINLPVNKRLEQAKSKGLCINCLRSGHFVRDCKSSFCRKCNHKHNTLLHIEKEPSSQEKPNKTAEVLFSNAGQFEPSQVLLATALIDVLDSAGKRYECKALLDSGSQSNLITSSFCKKLGLSTSKVEISVTGIGSIKSMVDSKSKLVIRSRTQNYSAEITCLVLSNICNALPTHKVNISNLNIPNHIALADPKFSIPSKIDMVLGAEIFWQLLCSEKIVLGKSRPVLQMTKLGWIITGPVPRVATNVYCNFSKTVDNNVEIQNQLSKFWTLEEVSTKPVHSAEEVACEDHFTKHVKRDELGRFIVSIPLKDDVSKLGDSKERSLSQFYSLERKLATNSRFKSLYDSFMLEYINLGHMSKSLEDKGETSYFMPHHGVLKEDSLTTKLRVVFNGSAPSTTGISLNDLQMIGPTIQNDLFAILIRFREYAYVACADITKMYRQILIDPSQRSLQKIVWRASQNEPIQEYELNTVTYGTASAPFLAIRCLFQLSLDSVSKYPDASRIIANDFYVDDLLTGSNSVDKLKENCTTVSKILKSGCFELRKWKSNVRCMNMNSEDTILHLGHNPNTKTLGVFWSCASDTLTYKISVDLDHNTITKRSILSSISQIFDPLGLLSICTIVAKLFLRKLWLANLPWDEQVSEPLRTEWSKFRVQLLELNSLQIPRHVSLETAARKELHIFCDASQEAYGACVYVRTIGSQSDNSVVNLLCAKSKVAPTKPVSIPRLELCAAVLASKLLDTVLKSTNTQYDSCTLWSDSTIVLAWIRTSPNLLKNFVCNRVVEIQALTSNFTWRHVPTKDNSADLLSRGVSPVSVKSLNLWWHGPEWLSKNPSFWPRNPVEIKASLPELKITTKVFVSLHIPKEYPINMFSNLNKLTRVVAYCLRFKTNSTAKRTGELPQYGSLTTRELKTSLTCIIKLVQRDAFSAEYKCLSEGTLLPRNSKLLGLNPFIDSDKLIRVGGRLQSTHFDYSKKHPTILPAKNHFTELLFRAEHVRLLHAGPQQLFYSIREKYWPLVGRNMAKKIVRQCTTCFRVKPQSINPLMGNLPASRAQPSYPFYFSGVDYGGPFLIKDRKGRGCKLSKGYVCLFVCFCTKAVHIELVSDLTKDAFIAAFRRFVARRGKPVEINSDNGTNFTGANNELKELGRFIVDNKQNLETEFRNEGVKWNFIPAHSPHMGGLWEAGIKSAKYHIKRIAGNASLTYEDFLTLLIQIEAVLNSRPLYPLSASPDDPVPLTPSHFLVGRPLTTIADPDVRHIPENRLSAYQRLQQLNQHFWTRWSKEYVSELQQRQRWKQNSINIKVGTIVLLKEDNLPPLCWMLGKIEAVHPGIDDIPRVVTVKTKTGLFRRAVAKVCPLPFPRNGDE